MPLPRGIRPAVKARTILQNPAIPQDAADATSASKRWASSVRFGATSRQTIS